MRTKKLLSLGQLLLSMLLCGMTSTSWALPKVGTPAPQLDLSQVLQAPSGSRASWEALRGKLVVLEFWATWCGPCVGNLPHLDEVAQAVDPQKVLFISVTDETPEVVGKFLKHHTMAGWVGLDTADKKTLGAFEIETRPTTIIIDGRGRVAAIVRPETLTAKGLMSMATHTGTAHTLKEARPSDGPATDAAKPAPSASGSAAPVTQTKHDPGGEFKLSLMLTENREQGYDAPDGSDGRHKGHTESGWPAALIIGNVWSVKKTRLLLDQPLPDRYYTLDVYLGETPDSLADSLVETCVSGALGIHVERVKRSHEVYVLEATGAAKDKLKLSSPDTAKIDSRVAGKLYLEHASIDDLASRMEDLFQAPFVNESGLPGSYDLTLSYPDHDTAAATKALEASGFTLSRQVRTIDMLEVEHIAKGQ